MFETIQKNGFLSINHDSKIKNELWGKVFESTYTTFFLGTYKGNDIMKYCVMFYNKFYEKHNFAIDYFMNDYILCIIKKRRIDGDMLSKIPYTSGSPFALMDTLEGKTLFDINTYRAVPQKIQRRNLNLEKLKAILNEIDMTNNIL